MDFFVAYIWSMDHHHPFVGTFGSKMKLSPLIVNKIYRYNLAVFKSCLMYRPGNRKILADFLSWLPRKSGNLEEETDTEKVSKENAIWLGAKSIKS